MKDSVFQPFITMSLSHHREDFTEHFLQKNVELLTINYSCNDFEQGKSDGDGGSSQLAGNRLILRATVSEALSYFSLLIFNISTAVS